MGKARHNIMMDDEIWKILSELKRIMGKSVSKILEEAVNEYLKRYRFNSLYFKLMATVPPCDEEENEELTKILDTLTEEDLEVVKVERL